MSIAWLSVLGGWWARLFGRSRASRTPAPDVAVPVTDRSASPAGDSLIGAALRKEAEWRPPTASNEEAAQSFIETLGLTEVPAVKAVKADPRERPQLKVASEEVRARTLAALSDLRQIPALQSLAQGFSRALNQPEVAVSEVVAAIEKDSALCVRVLRMANSVLVSSERRIEDLDTAVQMLGVARVRKAAQALFTLRDANRVAEGFDWKHLWIHALATAAIAEELEKQLRASEASQLYLAALLHDVGKIVLSTIAAEEYRDILVAAWHEHGELEELERARLGVDHREAGMLFAQATGMPALVVDANAHHDRPERAEAHRFDVALVALANHLAKAHGLGFSGARLGTTAVEFDAHPAWDVLADELGRRPDAEMLEAELAGFIGALRYDLREMSEVAA